MTATLFEQRQREQVPQELEIDRESPEDLFMLMIEAQKVLELDENDPNIGRYLKRKAVRRLRRSIQKHIDVSADGVDPLESMDVDTRMSLLSLYAQLLNSYANLMTSFNPDGSIFVQYTDATHAKPKDYGEEDPKFTELWHVSQQELLDRKLALELGERLVTLGYLNEPLLTTIAISHGALTERFSNLAWASPLGDERKKDLRDAVTTRIEHYLPVDEMQRQLGFDATMLAEADLLIAA